MKLSLVQMGVPKGMASPNKPPLPTLNARGFYDAGELMVYFAAAKKAGMLPPEMALHLKVPMDELVYWMRPDRIQRLALLAATSGGKK